MTEIKRPTWETWHNNSFNSGSHMNFIWDSFVAITSARLPPEKETAMKMGITLASRLHGL